MRIISLFGFGFSVGGQRLKASCSGAGGVRGSVRSFSLSTRLRLRKSLLEYSIPGYHRVGVTLTLPWVASSSDMDEFKRIMHRFRVYWIRRYPDCSFIYRVELQKRGSPHVHLVAYHNSPVGLVSDYFSLWYSSLLPSGRSFSLSDFARHGVKVDMMPDMSATLRYLCDHASKSKQAQLGYEGKQWGIVGKSNLVRRSGFPFEVTDRELVLLRRFCSRLCRFRVKSDCVFGSRLSRKRRGFSVCYVSDHSVLRFLASLKKNEIPPCVPFEDLVSSSCF